MKLNSKLSKTIAIFGIAGILACSSPEQNKNNDPQPTGRIITPETKLSFINENGVELSTLQIAVADEQLERNQGLMDVRSMGQDEGMLFIFDDVRPLSFWMANTPLSLDIMYVSADSVIVMIYPDTIPFSETSLPSGAPAKFVVETNAGYALTHGITEGMKIKF